MMMGKAIDRLFSRRKDPDPGLFEVDDAEKRLAGLKGP
jgi:hypothetical protein